MKTPQGSRNGPSRHWGSWNKPLSPPASSGLSTVVFESDVLYLNMVLQLQYVEQLGPAQNSERSWEGHRSFPPLCPWAPPKPMQEHWTSSGTPPTFSTHSVNCYHQENSSGHKGWNNRLINSFLPQAVRLMNCWSGSRCCQGIQCALRAAPSCKLKEGSAW